MLRDGRPPELIPADPLTALLDDLRGELVAVCAEVEAADEDRRRLAHTANNLPGAFPTRAQRLLHLLRHGRSARSAFFDRLHAALDDCNAAHDKYSALGERSRRLYDLVVLAERAVAERDGTLV